MSYPEDTAEGLTVITSAPDGTTEVNPGSTIATSMPSSIIVGPSSAPAFCPNCRANILTVTTRALGILAILAGASLCSIGCWCGCCLIPCGVNECMDVHHTCPNCKAFLGRFRRL